MALPDSGGILNHLLPVRAVDLCPAMATEGLDPQKATRGLTSNLGPDSESLNQAVLSTMYIV